MEGLSPPGSLSFKGNLAENWELWIQRFRLYSKASGLIRKEEDVRVTTLLYMIGDEALMRFNTFNLTLEERRNFNKVVNAFRVHFCSEITDCCFRQRFFARKQASGETFKTFFIDVTLLSCSCHFGLLRSSLIRDVIIKGLRDDTLRQILLKEPVLTLLKTINICMAYEKKQRNSAKKCSGQRMDVDNDNIKYTSTSTTETETSGTVDERYKRIMKLSPQLAVLLGESTMACLLVVKKIWAIIQERNLFDPKNKQYAICDDDLFKIFKVRRFRIFGMIRYLEDHFIN